MNFDAPALHVLLDLRDHGVDRPEGRALLHGGLVDAPALDEGLGHGEGGLAALGDREVDQRAEVVFGHLAPGRGRQLLHAVDSHAELLGRDERGHPAVADPRGALDGRLALAADPDGGRGLPGLGEDRHAVELVELALEAHLVLGPEQANDVDGLVGAPAALLERHAGGVELTRQLDADAHRREEAPAGEPVERRHLLGRHHRSPVGQHDHARAELERLRPRGHRGQRRHDLGHRRRRGQAVGEPERVDPAPLEEVGERPQEIDALPSLRPGSRHDPDAVLDVHGRDRTRAARVSQGKPW